MNEYPKRKKMVMRLLDRMGINLETGARSCCLVVLFAAMLLQAKTPVADVLFLSQHSLTDCRAAGLGNATIAMPDGLAAAYKNPALPQALGRMNPDMRIMSNVLYGRDNIFSNHIFAAGVGYTNNAQGAFGVFGRYLEADDNQRQYEASFFYSGRMFEQNLDHGAVDFGIAIRYEKMTWGYQLQDTLTPVKTWYHEGNRFDSVLTELAAPLQDAALREDKRVLLDVGFYQSRIADNVDFGLTINNVLGHIWREERPSFEDSVDVDVERMPIGQQQTAIESTYTVVPAVTNEKDLSKEWIDKYSRRFTAGITWTTDIFDGGIILMVPIELEILGILDKSRDSEFMFRSGIEARIRETLFLRFGYMRQPFDIVYEAEGFSGDNVFTGGMGLRLEFLAGDFFFSKDAWGVQMRFDY